MVSGGPIYVHTTPAISRIDNRLDLALEVGFGGFVGHVDAVAIDVELPAVVDAA
jgi:hypothetical protein